MQLLALWRGQNRDGDVGGSSERVSARRRVGQTGRGQHSRDRERQRSREKRRRALYGCLGVDGEGSRGDRAAEASRAVSGQRVRIEVGETGSAGDALLAGVRRERDYGRSV